MKPIFADSFYFLAILNPSDQHHDRAQQFAKTNVRPMVTTAWILTEVGDALAASNREMFVEFIENLRNNRSVRILASTELLFHRGIELYSQRLDKTWSLTDCISFVVMAEEHLFEAITADHHFEQAGYIALLK